MAAIDKKERRLQARITPAKEEYFMGVLFMLSAICKDPHGQEAALLIDNKDRLITFGVNHISQPAGYQNRKLSWDPEDRYLGMTASGDSAMDRALKLYVPASTMCEPFTSHTMYLTGPPTLRLVNRAAANGLKNFIYGPLRSQMFDEDDWKQAVELAKVHDMTLKEFNGNLGWLRDRTKALSETFRLF